MTPTTIREQVTMRIRDELISGEYPGGHVLREAELATRLGVSRGPVREAFVQLSNEGFLQYKTNRGVTVQHPPEPKQRAFIVKLRVQIESFVVEAGLWDADDTAMESIEAALKSMKAACGGEDAATVARSDIAFHQAILEACGGTALVQVWRQTCTKMLMSYSRLLSFAEVYREHLAIMESLRTRDTRAVVAAIRNNVR